MWAGMGFKNGDSGFIILVYCNTNPKVAAMLLRFFAYQDPATFVVTLEVMIGPFSINNIFVDSLFCQFLGMKYLPNSDVPYWPSYCIKINIISRNVYGNYLKQNLYI